MPGGGGGRPKGYLFTNINIWDTPPKYIILIKYTQKQGWKHSEGGNCAISSLMFGSYIMPRRTSETSYNNKIFNMPIPKNRTIIGDSIVEKPNFKK